MAISRAWPGGLLRVLQTFSEQFLRKLDQHEAVNKDGARVLVVDDEPNITELVAMALRYEGFSVKTAATGRAALSAVTQFSPALVILDIMLPDIDGLEVLRRLNSAGAKIPIIFLTAKDATEDKVHGLTIGGDDYVTKPFSVEELMAKDDPHPRRPRHRADQHRVQAASLPAHQHGAGADAQPDPRPRMALRLRR
jgi:DNA-binding response OmpR family regulator